MSEGDEEKQYGDVDGLPEKYFNQEYLDAVPRKTRVEAKERLTRLTNVDLTAYSPDPETLLEDASMHEFKHTGGISGYKRILDFMEPYLRRLLSTPATKLTEVIDRNQLCEYLYESLQVRLEAIQKRFVFGRVVYLNLLAEPTKENLETFANIPGSIFHPNAYPHFNTFCGPYGALIKLENGFRYRHISKECVKAIFQWFILTFDQNRRFSVAEEAFKGKVEDYGYEVSKELLNLDIRDWVPATVFEDEFEGLRHLPTERWKQDYYWDDWMPKYLDSFETVIKEYVEYLEEISE